MIKGTPNFQALISRNVWDILFHNQNNECITLWRQPLVHNYLIRYTMDVYQWQSILLITYRIYSDPEPVV